MKRPIRSFLLASVVLSAVALGSVPVSADDYETRQARSYISDAEYQMKRAETYRRDAQYYKNRAESEQRDANYYTRQGNASKAKECLRRAENAMDTYNDKMRYAKEADRNAADYLIKASNYLKY